MVGAEPVSAPFRHEIETASRLAKEAGKVVLEVYRTFFTVKQKGAAGPVTEADIRAHELIVSGLRQEFPGDVVISEEDPPSTVSRPGARVWYVDPLDGTQEFVDRTGEFSVMLGLAIDNRPTVGVVLRPVDEALFIGIADREAWLEIGGTRRPLCVSRESDLSKMRLAVSRSHRHARIDEVRIRLGITEEIRCGSVGLKIGLIAQGQADLYVEPGRYTHAWDVCGPEAILRGAGGRMTDLDGRPLRYESSSDLRNKSGLIATNGVCHDRVIAAIGF